MSKITLTLLALSLLFPVASFAGGSSGTQVLERVAIGTDGLIQLDGVEAAWNNPDGCDASDVLIMPAADETGTITDINATIAAAVIAAKLKGTPVSAFVNGCVDLSGTTYPRVRTVRLR